MLIEKKNVVLVFVIFFIIGEPVSVQPNQPQIIGAQQNKPNVLHISTSGNDSINGSMANLSPNARMGTFTPPQTKNHRVVVGHVGQPTFQHPMQRPVSVQIPRQAQIQQQRILASPFSPQTPQSPHDQFPLSPATSTHEQFSRPASECSQSDPYLNVSIFFSCLFILKFTMGFCIFFLSFKFSLHKRLVHLDIIVQQQALVKVQLIVVQLIK